MTPPPLSSRPDWPALLEQARKLAPEIPEALWSELGALCVYPMLPDVAGWCVAQVRFAAEVRVT